MIERLVEQRKSNDGEQCAVVVDGQTELASASASASTSHTDTPQHSMLCTELKKDQRKLAETLAANCQQTD